MKNEKTTYIYTISDENDNVRYIGKSNNPKRRIYQHINEKFNKHKYNWLQSIIKRGEFPKIEVIDEVLESEWQVYEIYWISQFKTWGFNLINKTIGGYGPSGYKHKSSSRKKMRNAKLGTTLSDDHKEKISKSVKNKYKKCPNYNRSGNNVLNPIDKDLLYRLYIKENLTMPQCAEKLNVSETTVFRNLKNYNIKKSKEVLKEQYSTNPIKTVLQYDLNGNLIKEWNEGPNHILKETGIQVASCCRGLAKTSKGFIWRYKDEWFDLGLDKLDEQSRQVSQYDLNGNWISDFVSIRSASDVLNVSESGISACCKKKVKSCGGFIFIYKGDSAPKKYKNRTVRSVAQYDKNGNLISIFDSMAAAQRETGIGSNNIQMCCVGKYKTSGGFVWKYNI